MISLYVLLVSMVYSSSIIHKAISKEYCLLCNYISAIGSLCRSTLTASCMHKLVLSPVLMTACFGASRLPLCKLPMASVVA